MHYLPVSARISSVAVMIDDDVALFGGDPNKACRAYSDPLFLTDYFMEAGYTAAVHNQGHSVLP